MISKVLTPTALAVAALVVVTQAIPALQSPMAAKHYEFFFPANSDKLPSQTGGSSALAAAIDLLVHQGRRRELTFVMTSVVSKSCMEWPDCPDRMLLMHRAEHIVDALRNSWPADIEKSALERLRWEAVPPIASARDPDRVQILLRIKSSHGQDCPDRLELLDPYLPGTVENPDRAQWIEVSADQPVAISPSARLRVSQTDRGQQSVEVWLNADVESILLRPRLDQELGESVFVVNGSQNRFWITLKRTGDTSAAVREMVQREGSQSRIGETVAGFPSTAPGGQPPTPCTFGFERWIP